MTPEVRSIVEGALSWWSIVIQLGVVSVLTILLFITWSATRRKVMATWVIAWAFDSIALGAVLVIATAFRILGPEENIVIYTVYSTAKILFALFLVLGLFQFRRVPASMGANVAARIGLVAAGWCLLVLFVFPDAVQIQTVTYAAVAFILIAGSAPAVARGGERGARVAGIVFFMHGLLFFQHFMVLTPGLRGLPVPGYMSRISFVDAIAEFLVGLSCALAAGLRAVEDAQRANRRLEASERTLRTLVDADPLTGLFNRRRLRRFFESTGGRGIVLFVDIDRFKSINDAWGHATGDVCLLRAAESLRKVFRSEDGLFRLGGDEFLVVAPGLDRAEAEERVRELRRNLGRPDERGIGLEISVGMAAFDETVRPDEAMTLADASMYRDKGR